ncbi:MAG: cobalamin-dependent protein, partial [Fusobacteriaceae bacterium]
MNKYLLVAINSQYIHTNLAVRYLKKYVERYSDKSLEIYETNINNQLSNIIKDIFEKNPKIIIFSTYIWNRDYVFKIIKELKKILPSSKIGMGGPEVTYDSIDILESYQEVDFLVKGEGENALLKIVTENIDKLEGI